MSPQNVGDMMEKIRCTQLEALVFQGPVSGCAGQAHEASHIERAGIGTLRTLKCSVQQSYPEHTRSVCELSELVLMRVREGFGD